jgi:hypothetical protein
VNSQTDNEFETAFVPDGELALDEDETLPIGEEIELEVAELVALDEKPEISDESGRLGILSDIPKNAKRQIRNA